MKDYYDVLGISREASNEEVEDAYRKLLKANKLENQESSGETSLIYEELREAYLILSDREKKRLYDRQLMDYDAEKEWKKRQLETVGVKKKKKPFIDKKRDKKKIWVLSIVALVVFVVFIGFAFFDLGDLFNRKEYVSGIQEVKVSENRAKTVSEKKDDKTKEVTKKVEDKEGDTKGDSNKENVKDKAPEKDVIASKTRSETKTVSTNNPVVEDKKTTASSSPTPKNTERTSSVANAGTKTETVSSNNTKFSSLEDYFIALGDDNLSFSEKSAMVNEALKYFDNNNSNVLIYGTNNVQTGREAIANYLDIVMIQNYKVSILNLKKNNNGKITQISVKEAL